MSANNNKMLTNNSIRSLSLYQQSLGKFVNGINLRVMNSDRMQQIQMLPPLISSDIYKHMAENERLRDLLLVELSNMKLFCKLLKYPMVHENLLKIFKIMMSATPQKPLAMELQRIFVQQATYTLRDMIVRRNNEKLIAVDLDQDVSESESDVIADDQLYVKLNESRGYWKKIDDGLRLGSFLCETGWLEDAIKVLNVTKFMIIELDDTYTKQILLLNCYQKLIHAQALFCCFKEAIVTTSQALNLIDKIHVNYSGQNDDFKVNGIPDCVLADFYHELSLLYFNRSEYDASYKWGVKAMEYLRDETPPRIIVNVLRQAAKSCVVKRKFQLACLLVNNAVKIAESAFGRNNSVYADSLLDKGFLLLNIDSITKSVEAYQEAAKIKKDIYGEKNLNVAKICEDLAYALYVYEYSRGHFDKARYYVEQAICVMSELASNNEIMLASAKRVKALILEEIALDNISSSNARDYKGLLKESEELHRSALNLSLDAFGEINVQTAKHYGNLGRLYQSMKRYSDAEEMHKRAIRIKRDLLGDCDYEVGLSIGHLASLYNYHMKKYREAEELYLRSINISLKLFGQTYSGLEYDYRGLLHVYEEIHDFDNFMKFQDILDEWRIFRSDDNRRTLYDETADEMDIEDVKLKFSVGNKCAPKTTTS